uniref:G_PROTEIN_RECEP_F1_2 domain-containing protein n=1 Tax=Caenorhabditis japonica TaxID=281687 RepID=A0A8R1E211_CAEJA
MDTVGKCPSLPSSWAIAFDGPISFVVIFGGVIGNVYSMKQLFSRSINTSMLVSLTGLAIWDIVLLIAALWHHSLWATMQYFSFRDEPWDAEMVSMNALVECGHITSTWMLIEVVAERFIAVTRPFQFAPVHRKQRRKSYARVVGGLIRIPLMMTIAACVICLPCTIEYTLEPCMYKEIESQHGICTMFEIASKLVQRTVPYENCPVSELSRIRTVPKQNCSYQNCPESELFVSELPQIRTILYKF